MGIFGEVSMGTMCIVLGVLGLIAYFIGNISPSTIMAKRQGLDIKKEGSGNAGPTNALRVMGKKAGAITCIVDILKGVVAVLIGLLFGGPMAAYVCALCVFLGHVWPIVYKFQGGKGQENVLVDIIALGFGAEGMSDPEEAAETVADSWMGIQYLDIKEGAWEALLDYYTAEF